MSMSARDLAALIKSKYEEYKDDPDDELVARVVSKYDEYRSDLKEFHVQGAEKLNGLSTPFLRHYLNLYGQFEQAGITPIIKSGVRSAEQQHYLHTHGYPTHGNDGYNQISPHQEGRAIDFSFAPAHKSQAQQILAQYARANGLHIPSDEPWHLAILKDQAERSVAPAESNPDTAPEWMVDPSKGNLRADYGAASERVRRGLPTIPTEPSAEPGMLDALNKVTQDVNRRTAYTGISHNDVAHHFGITDEEWERMKPKQQMLVARLSAEAAASDMAKRQKGQTEFPVSLNYQNENRAKVGLVALSPQPEAEAKSNIPDINEILREATHAPEAEIRSQIRKQVEREQQPLRIVGLPSTLNPIAAVENYLNDDPFGVEAEVEKRYQAHLRSQTPEMVKDRKEYGEMAPMVRAVIAPVNRAGGGIIKMMGGLASLAGLTPNQLSEWANARGQIVEEAASLAPLTKAGEEIKRRLPEKIVSALADVGIGIAEIVLLKKATGMPLGRLLAIETALKTNDQPLSERVPAVAESYLMGKVLEQHLSRPASAALFGVPTAARGGVSVLQGNMSIEDAILQTAVQSGVGLAMGGKPKGEVPRVPEEPSIEQFNQAQAEYRAQLEKGKTNAIETGQIKQGREPEHLRTSQGEDLRAYSGEVRSQEGAGAISSDRAGQSGQVEQEGQVIGEGPLHRASVEALENAQPDADGLKRPRMPYATEENVAQAQAYLDSLPHGSIIVDADGNRYRVEKQPQIGTDNDGNVNVRPNKATLAQLGEDGADTGLYLGGSDARSTAMSSKTVSRPSLESQITELERRIESAKKSVAKREAAGEDVAMTKARQAHYEDLLVQLKGQHPKVGEPLAHPNPVLDGKPIVATTEAGKAVVANPENKGGISVVKHQPEVPALEPRTAESNASAIPAIPPAGQPPLAEVAPETASTPVEPLVREGAQGLDANAPSVESSVNTLSGEAEFFGSSANAQAFRDKGLGGLDVPSQNAVLSHVIRVIHDPQVRDRIIKLIPVDVVDMLARVKSSSEVLLHDKSVLPDGATVNPDHTVSIPIDVADTLVRGVAGLTTKGSPALGDAGGLSGELNPTVEASTIDQRHVAAPLVESNVSGVPDSKSGTPPILPHPLTVEASQPSPREVVEAAGLTYLGEQQRPGGKPPLQLFNTPDGATLAIDGEVTPQTVAEKVKAYYEKKAGLPVVPSAEDLAPEVGKAENVLRETSAQTAPAEPLREARIPTRPVVTGAETEVSIPDSDRTYRARYVVRELEDVVPSHNAFNFQPREDYWHTNDRHYESEPQYQTQVMDRSKSTGKTPFKPRALLNNSPTSEVGPSIIDSNGNVLGGTSRELILERIYAAADPTMRDAYRSLLMEQASIYGVDPKQIETMERPGLFRELSDEHLSKPEVQRAITELNRTSTTPLTSAEQANSAAGNVSEDAAKFLTQMIERGGDDATIRSVMDDDGVAIINKLIEDGVIQPGERNVLLKDGKVTPAAKDRIEQMLVSSVYRNLKQMEDTPSGVRRNIERIAAPLRRIAGTEWDLGDKVKTAIDAINEAKETAKGDLDLLASQFSLARAPYTADEIALAKALRLGPRKTAEKFRGYANDFAAAEMPGGQGSLYAAPTQPESLMVHFGIDQIIKAHPDPVVDEVAKRIIAAAEYGELGNLSASVEDAPSEARMRIQGLTAEIAKEKASGQEATPIEQPVGSGSEAGAKVPEQNQSAPRVPEQPSAAGAEDVALQEQLRQAQAEFRASRVPTEPTENLGPGAASIKEKPPEVKERQFGIKLMSDEQVAQDIKDSLGTSRFYEPIPNDVTAKDAQRLVDERGIPQSMHAIMDENNNIPFHVRSAMGQIVIKRLNQTYKALKNVEPSDAEIVLDQATNMAEWQMDYGTRLGQGVQSFAMWARLTPEGKLLTFKRAVNKARQRHLALKGGEVQQVLEGMKDARVVEVKPEDTKTVVPAIRKALAKRAVKARKAAEKGDEDTSIWQEYKDSIAKQLFNIASPGKTKPSPPLQEFSERLLANVEPLIRKPETQRAKPDLYGNLREVVENFDKYRDAWNEAVAYIRGKYDQKSVAELSEIERRITDLHSAFQTKAFDRVFESAVRQAEINFQEIAKAHYLDRQATRDSLTHDIFTGLGIKLSPEDAVDLTNRIEQRMDAKIIIARQRILKGMEKSNSVARKVQPLTDKIIEAARVGVLNEQKFYDIASEKLGLPKYDPQVAARILDLAGHVEDAVDGIPKDRAILDLNRYIASQKGFGAEDLPIGIYYGNILSGYNTHIVNAVDTAMNVLSEVNGLAITNPRAAAKVYAGALRGLLEGRFDAMMALTEGRMKTQGKWMESPQLMEIAQFGQKGGVPIDPSGRIGRAFKTVAESKIGYPLNAYKYVSRLLAASDTVFAQSAKEARAALLADRMARAEGLTGDALNGRVKEILALDRDADFRAQAVREGFTGSETTVRANELRDMIRDASLESDAAEFAGEATYNHEPHGLAGLFSQTISRMSQSIPALKLFVPFTRIVANVTNRGLNWTPYGYKRAFGYGKVVEGRYQLFGEPLTPEAQRLMLVRATMGTAGMVLLASLQSAGVLTIHGAGPSDIERRKQLQGAGWRPYSIQLGNHFISYTPTPVGLGLSIIGNMSDAERYHELEQKDIATRGAYAVARVGSTVFSQSFLSGLSRLFNALSENPSESVTAVKQTLSGTASSLTVPALGKDVYKLFDNKAYQSNTLMQDLIRNTPFAALALKPQLNAFGEPVRVQRQRFLDVMTSDPEWRFVIEKGLRVPVPSKTSEVEEYSAEGTRSKRRITPDEYYELLSKTGPRVKLWIGMNRDRLAGVTEQDAQKWLSQEAGNITADEMTKLRSAAKVQNVQPQTAAPTVPMQP